MESLQGFEVVRAAPTAVRAAKSEDGTMPTMEVRFSTFDQWYEIDSIYEGRFLERTQKGAFSRAIKAEMSAKRDREEHAIKVQFDHGHDPQIGGKLLGTVADMREEDDAAVGVVRLFDASYVRDLLPGLEAGVYGSSMRMVVTRDEWDDAPVRSDHNPDGIPERTIKEVRLYEFGPVVWPANPGATAGLRSLTDTYYERAEPEVRERARQACTPPADRPGDDATRAADGPAESTTPPVPAASHPGGLTPAQRREVLLNMTLGRGHAS